MYQGIEQIFRKLQKYNAAICVDRDGTLVNDINYPYTKLDLIVKPTVIEGLKLLNENKVAVIVVTNQPIVSHGYSTVKNLKDMNTSLVEKISKDGAIIDAIYSCPHHPEGNVAKFSLKCDCRKPGISSLLKSKESFKIKRYIGMIGDMKADIEFGQAAQIPSVLLSKTSHVKRGAFGADYVSTTFIEAVNKLLNYESNNS